MPSFKDSTLQVATSGQALIVRFVCSMARRSLASARWSTGEEEGHTRHTVGDFGLFCEIGSEEFDQPIVDVIGPNGGWM